MTINFETLEARAAEMTDAELHYARLDAARTAEAMDALDREEGGDRASCYRDEAATYARELRRRAA